MTIRNLASLFEPASVALVETGSESHSVTSIVARNLIDAGFKGKILPVTSKSKVIEGLQCYPDIAGLPTPPELAVVTGPLDSIPAQITELGRRGAKAVAIVNVGLIHCESGEQRENLRKSMLDAAKPHLLRIAGPGSTGVMAPGPGLNAGIAHIQPLKGDIAFVTQSAAVLSSVLDWAVSHSIGFSHLVSLGDMIDVDFGDMLDYLAGDPSAKAILLYIESVTNARKFMSAARAASRVKPVIVLKGGRYAEAVRVAPIRAEDPSLDDAIYHAVFRRAGMLRAHDIQDLFDAAETLARSKPFGGDRLAILTNGGGMGVLATDAILSEGGRLAELSSDSVARLDELLPRVATRKNPVDILADAPGKRYADALEALLADKGVDAALVLYCPNVNASGAEAARAVIDAVKKSGVRGKSQRLLTCWLGGGTSAAARGLFAENGIPTYGTPNEAVRGFMQVARFRRNQEMLMETPPTIPDSFIPDTGAARRAVDQAFSDNRSYLSGAEVRALLRAYGIPIVDEQAAADCSRPLNEATAQVQLIIRVMDGGQFGPMILFGHGGPAADLVRDRALALPPLNLSLARDLIARTRIFRLMEGAHGLPAPDIGSVALTLAQVSQMICDIADIAELTINPLVAGPEGVMALDARVRIAGAGIPAAHRLAIRPYPKELEEEITLPDGQKLLLRPIRPEDEPALYALFSMLSPEEIRLRFLSPMKMLPRTLAARLTQIDYDREMALMLFGKNAVGASELYGGIRIIADPDNERAEFAILLRRDMTGSGLGPMLMRRIIDYAKSRGTGEIYGDVLADNRAMLRLCQAFGFNVKRTPDDPGVLYVTLKL
jgi:acyl-CoA synthetase (NDP forming)/RimJ/RimL family protein N-acetyltransferase